MKRKVPFLLIIIAASLSNSLLAQPGLKALQQRSAITTDPGFTITVSPKNQSLGSILFSPSANVSLADAQQWLGNQLRLRPGVDELKKRTVAVDHSEMQVIKFGQYFKGIKVEHSVINVAASGGQIGLIQMEFYTIADNFAVTPAISADIALQKAMKYTRAKKFTWENNVNGVAGQKPSGELVIIKDFLSLTDTVCLAYKFPVTGSEPVVNADVYVNAIDGTVVLSDNNAETLAGGKAADTREGQPAILPPPPSSAAVNAVSENVSLGSLSYTNSVGTANTLYSGTQDIYTDEVSFPSHYFRLNQSFNGFNIETRNGRNALGPVAWIENDDNNWTTAAVDDTALEVHFNLQAVANYWKKRFGRNSYDNAGSDMIAYVHLTDTDYISNAYWHEFTPWWPTTASMNYGDNVAPNKPVVSLDVTGHEFGHAVASAPDMPHFVYQRESGALDEGFSDIWGACIEKYNTDLFPSSLGKKNIWTIGEEPFLDSPIRDLVSPKNKNMADTYYGAFYEDISVQGCPVPDQKKNDLCHVHQNSSIITKWFSLITVGGKGTNDHNYDYNVTGLGFGLSDSIAYNTERMLSPNADYHAVMHTSINYTSFKYGATSNQLAKVIAAWRAVGVLDTLYFSNTTTPVFETNNSFTCVAVGKNGHVWAGTSGKGLFKYNDLEWKKYGDALGDSIVVNKVSYRDIKSDPTGGIWIAQAGYSGVSGTTNSSGGVYYFSDTTFKSKRHYSSSPVAYKRNVISRCVTSIWVDPGRNNTAAATRGKILPQVWAVSMSQTNAAVVNGEIVGKPACGGVAMGLTDTVTSSPNGASYDSNFIKVATPYLTNVDNNALERGAQTIGGNSDEVWVYSDANNESSSLSWGYGTNYYKGSPQQIMRYKASNGDSVGAYTAANVSLLGTSFIAKAIYFDKNNNRWLGLSTNNNAVVAMDNHGSWHGSAVLTPPVGSSDSLPEIFPVGTIVSNNAITGDQDGFVYIGTNNGLVVYTGGETGLLGASPLEDYKSYRRYTVNDGLPSNTIRGLAVDTIRHGVWLATDNGIVLWRMRGAKRQIRVSKVNLDKCSKEITYTINMKGKFYNTPVANELITELSDANGSFNAPTVLETENWYEPVFENDPAGFDERKKITLPFILPNGDHYLIRVRATNPAFIGALSAPFAIKKPNAIIPSSGAVSHSADRECLDGNNWTNYFFSNGTPDDETDDILLLSIHKEGTYIGTVGDGTFDVTVAATPGAGSNFGVNVSNVFINNPFVSMNRFWKVTPTLQPAKNVVVRFYYNSQDLVDVNGSINYGPIDHTKLVFYKTNGNPNPTTNLAGLTAPPISYTNDLVLDLVKLDKWVYTQLGPGMHRAEFIVTGFSGGSGGSTPNSGPLNTLPLQLVSFTARINKDKTLLQWETSAEINTSYFEVERSEDETNFHMVGHLTAAGNSNMRKNYSLTDEIPASGKNYYRLKMADRDGKFTYSPVRLVIFNKNDRQVNIYPNPSTDVLTIENNLPGKILSISIIDMAGRKLLQFTKDNSPVVQISISKLATGSYILQLNDGSDIVNTKVEKR